MVNDDRVAAEYIHTGRLPGVLGPCTTRKAYREAVTLPDVDEDLALAWLCENLPRFRAAAASRTHLAKIVDGVREGRRSAVWAMRRLGVGEMDRTDRGSADGLVVLDGLGLDPVHVRGEFVCPHDRCRRLGTADDRGREPVCHLGTSPTPMRFRGDGCA